ncbi:MAG: hypothetical protein A3K19_10200 [Lentisphaerae bacterium RIFOXYB12_FULL_65_16]|nr:MAG: hypothetical protein A3K18_27640 [Lentisphaerae bacterium RIFOXYA12_64_32]OGV91318.1 MAG: hypothetical protein A3K19_10200 [Lentisphaerae bacterium RIFOXYB12_FULL_65_16]
MAYLSAASQVLYYLTMGYGVYVCVAAYRGTRYKAWLLIGVFCLSPFLSLVTRQVSGIIYGSPLPHQMVAAAGDVPNTPRGTIPERYITWHMPVFPLLLVWGLSLVAEEHLRRNREVQGTTPTGG